MMDIWMFLTLLFGTLLVLGFIVWCDKAIEDTGGEGA